MLIMMLLLVLLLLIMMLLLLLLLSFVVDHTNLHLQFCQKWVSNRRNVIVVSNSYNKPDIEFVCWVGGRGGVQ